MVAGRSEGSLVPCPKRHNTVEYLEDADGNRECLLCHSGRNFAEAGLAVKMKNFWEIPLVNQPELGAKK